MLQQSEGAEGKVVYGPDYYRLFHYSHLSILC